MSPTPRRSPVRPVLTRERICDAGRSQLESVGLDGLSLREVARSLGVTGPALYAHVDGKRGLIAAIAEDAFAELAGRFAALEVDDPVERIAAQARVYVEHAMAAPHLYRVMMQFAPSLPRTGAEQLGVVATFGPATLVFDAAMVAVIEASEQGRLIVSDPLVAALTLWAAMHGLVDTMLMGLGLSDELTSQLIDAVLDTTLRGLVIDPPVPG